MKSKLKPFSFDTITVMTTMMMDGYEYERKVLWPIWNKEKEFMMMSQNASASNNNNTSTRERLKNELGIDLPKNPVDIELGLSNRMFKNPDNFVPELSSDNLVWDLGRRFRNQKR